jgi:hypothetical protein
VPFWWERGRRAIDMIEAVIAIFVVVYLGMSLGGMPFLQLDRAGVALSTQRSWPITAKVRDR